MDNNYMMINIITKEMHGPGDASTREFQRESEVMPLLIYFGLHYFFFILLFIGTIVYCFITEFQSESEVLPRLHNHKAPTAAAEAYRYAKQ